VCLKRGHISRKCKATVECSSYRKRHYTVMCGSQCNRGEYISGEVTKITGQVEAIAMTPTTMTNSIQQNTVVLKKTLRVRVRCPTAGERNVRLMFDEGSTKSYIKTSLAIAMRLPVLGTTTSQSNLFGGILSEAKTRNNYFATVEKLYGKFKTNLDLTSEDMICGSCPSIPKDL